MPKKNKEVDDRLQTIEYLLAGLLLKKDPNIKEVAKILGCSDKKLTELFPERKNNKSNKISLESTSIIEKSVSGEVNLNEKTESKA